VDPKWCSITWWEDRNSVRLKNCDTVQDLLARGAGSTPETALHLIIGKPYIFLFSRTDVDLMSLAIIRNSGRFYGSLGTLRIPGQ
jgi:hypothetical protein